VLLSPWERVSEWFKVAGSIRSFLSYVVGCYTRWIFLVAHGGELLVVKRKNIVGGEVLNMTEFNLREKDEIDFYAISLVYGFNIPI